MSKLWIRDLRSHGSPSERPASAWFRRIRSGVVLLLLGILCLISPDNVGAQTGALPAEGLQGGELFASDLENYLCPRQIVQRTPQRCPPFGPGTRQARISYLSARLPRPLPDLPATQLPQPVDSVTSFTYGRIYDLPAPSYRHPAEAAMGLDPLRIFQSNINWVSLRAGVTYGDELWYQVNANEYIRAQHIDFPEPSSFQGVQIIESPEYPFAWLRRALQPSPAPGASPAPVGDSVLPIRHLVSIFATETLNGERWVMVGPGQWIQHDAAAQVTPKAPPPGVPPGAKWIEIDTYEQTLAAYEGERLVYATLTTSGQPEVLTPLGLFRIYRKVRTALMQSIDRPMDDRFWYYLEDVEHAQFFNERISLHAAYWHDDFGSVRSNGCVNLAPLDARWLYAWTDPQLPPGASWVSPEVADEGQTWIWVHHSAPALIQKPPP